MLLHDTTALRDGRLLTNLAETFWQRRKDAGLTRAALFFASLEAYAFRRPLADRSIP